MANETTPDPGSEDQEQLTTPGEDSFIVWAKKFVAGIFIAITGGLHVVINLGSTISTLVLALVILFLLAYALLPTGNTEPTPFPTSIPPTQIIVVVLPTSLEINVIESHPTGPTATPTATSSPTATWYQPTPSSDANLASSIGAWSTPIPLGTIVGQHLVRPGETLYCIARAYRVLPIAIAQANSLVSPSRIYPGQLLQIPDNPWYAVPAGETCVRQFGALDITPTCITTTPES